MTDLPLAATGSFPEALAEAAALTDASLGRLLAVPEGPEARVFEAMRYSALAPGKRLRPFLVLASAQLFSVAQRSALQAAAAVELIHAYSLVVKLDSLRAALFDVMRDERQNLRCAQPVNRQFVAQGGGKKALRAAKPASPRAVARSRQVKRLHSFR